MPSEFAAVAITLYVAHHVGDYWVQTDHQARHKGEAGPDGAIQCLLHVLSYTATQAVLLLITALALDLQFSDSGALGGFAVSAVTHYLADRREHGIMFRLARALPGKAKFLTLGTLRAGRDDNPTLGTGAWALDQSWHIFWGVFVAALIMTA